MEKALKLIAASLPLVFAFAFMAPVIDQGIQALGIGAPFSLATLTFGLLIAGAWGLFATITARWV